MYTDDIKKTIYNYKPGLSGIGSIVFRNEEEIIENIDDKAGFYKNIIMPYKGKLEGWFAENISILNYFKIIFVTVVIVLRTKSNIWKKLFKDLSKLPEGLEIC
jgi:lipopolysaccharide/colanic/teichoic acid biosynthesis glycosyltransferase